MEAHALFHSHPPFFSPRSNPSNSLLMLPSLPLPSLFLFFLLSLFLPQGGTKFYKKETPFWSHNHYTSAILSKSVCFKRVPIPHFLLDRYTLPGSSFVSPEECLPDDSDLNRIRTSLTPDQTGEEGEGGGGGEGKPEDFFHDDDFRLPRTVRPIHYLLKLCPEVEEPFDVNGTVEIELEVRQSTHQVTLNMLDLDIQTVSLWYYKSIIPSNFGGNNGFGSSSSKTLTRRKNSKFQSLKKFNSPFVNAATNQSQEGPRYRRRGPFISPTIPKRNKKVYLPIDSVKIDKELQRMTVHLKNRLTVSKVYKLRIAFKGYVSDALTGFYKTYHYDTKFQRRYSLVTQFQVSEARKVFPCFDEPGFKSTFSLILCRNKTYQTLSNMPKVATLVSRKTNPNRVWDLFRTSVPMSTYLVAFAVLDDFEYVQCNHSLIPFKVWGPSTKIESSTFACDVSPRLLDFFENYFQFPYPLPKMDLIALPHFFALGMENWGLVTFMWDRLLIEADAPSVVKSQQDALETISHEMAHQWFGNLVTPAWWSDIWLNEGFATFLSLLGVDYVRPSWQKMKEYVVDVLHNVLASDSMESSHPISVNVSDPKDFFSIFDEIAYGKGCFIVRMMMHILTERAFQTGLQTYLEKLQYKSASQDDLWYFLTKAGHDAGALMSNLSIAEIMDNWVVQEGYPVVNVKRLSHTYLELEQTRFYLEKDESIAARKAFGDEGPTWWIPVSMATKRRPNMTDTSPKFWLNSRSHVIQVSEEYAVPLGDWYLANVQQTGVYRVNYDVDNWLLLTQQLSADHLVFDDITRAQIIDDSFSLAYAEIIDYAIPLQIVSYMKKEKSPYVITAFLNNIRPIFNSFSHDALYGEFKSLFLSLMADHFPSHGMFKRGPELPFEKSTTDLLIKTLCYVHKPCIKEAQEVFALWAENQQNYSVIEDELVETAFCVVVSEGGEEEWELIWTKFHSDVLSDKQYEMITALACSRHLWLNSRLLLALSMDHKSFLSRVFLPIALASVAANPVGVSFAWEFLKHLWPKVRGNLLEQNYFEAVVPALRTQAQLNELLGFVTAQVIGGETKMHRNYIEESIKNLYRKIDFQHRNYKEFFEWFLGQSTKNGKLGGGRGMDHTDFAARSTFSFDSLDTFGSLNSFVSLEKGKNEL